MYKAIELLKIEAANMRNISTPNSSTITEYSAQENKKLAEEYEFAAEVLRKIHNGGFSEGILSGLKSLQESCKARRDKAS